MIWILTTLKSKYHCKTVVSTLNRPKSAHTPYNAWPGCLDEMGIQKQKEHLEGHCREGGVPRVPDHKSTTETQHPKRKEEKKKGKKIWEREWIFFWGGSGSECLMFCIVLVADDTWLTHMQAFVGAHCNRPTEAHGPRGKRKFIGPPYPLCRCSKIYPPFFFS